MLFVFVSGLNKEIDLVEEILLFVYIFGVSKHERWKTKKKPISFGNFVRCRESP